ncbi:hypothetical protein CsSME_00020295 [Camellia sinensis var. sinensis]
MEIEPGIVTPPSQLVTREEPLISLAPAGKVGKKWKKIVRPQIGDFGLDTLHVGHKRSLIDTKVLVDEVDSKEKRARLDDLVVGLDSTVVAGIQPRRQL